MDARRLVARRCARRTGRADARGNTRVRQRRRLALPRCMSRDAPEPFATSPKPRLRSPLDTGRRTIGPGLRPPPVPPVRVYGQGQSVHPPRFRAVAGTATICISAAELSQTVLPSVLTSTLQRRENRADRVHAAGDHHVRCATPASREDCRRVCMGKPAPWVVGHRSSGCAWFWGASWSPSALQALGDPEGLVPGILLLLVGFGLSLYLAYGGREDRPRAGGVAWLLPLTVVVLPHRRRRGLVRRRAEYVLAALGAAIIPLTAVALIVATTRSKTVGAGDARREASAERRG